MKKTLWMLTAVLALTACRGSRTENEKAEADRLINAAYKAKDYSHLMTLADSLQQNGLLSPSEAYYWQGYASDHMMQQRAAEFYWKMSVDEAQRSDNKDELAIYAKSGSRLANLLSIRGDYEAVLKEAIPVAERLEELHCDTTSDYTNLLIFIGCCQSRFGLSNAEANASYERAYKLHMDNVESSRSEKAYKNAIAGIINIAYNCIGIGHFDEALTWTDRFGKLISQYEMKDDANTDYTDKQWARYHIYRATALEGLGRKDEATEVYADYLQTQFSQTTEGHIDAADFLIAAERWDEAADSYGDIDLLQTDLSLENIQKTILRKYKANRQAGRNDAANLVANQICESLDSAITMSRRMDVEEQKTIREKEVQIAQQHARDIKLRTAGLLAALALVFAFFSAYSVYRRKKTLNLTKEHEELKSAYAQLEQTATAKERTGSELRIAQDILKNIVAPTPPQRDDLDLYASLVPTKQVAADFYDYRLCDEKLLFCIGDVSGKGVQAAMTTVLMQAQFRSVTAYESTPARIVEAINTAMCQNSAFPVSATLFVGALNTQTGRLKYCNAGHNAPLLIGSGIGALPVDPNTPVGQHADQKFTAQETLIDPGSVIFLYTNGLTKAEDATHRQFGEERMTGEAMQTIYGLDAAPQAVVERMTETLNRFTGGTEQADDIAMLAIRYTKQADGVRYQRSITLANDTEEVLRLATFVDKVCKNMHFNATVTSGMHQALEEALVSVMSHAYPEGRKGSFGIEAKADNNTLTFVIRDQGEPFDPTAPKATPDGQTPNNGLGIGLARHYMDAVSYERIENQNVLTLTKNLV